MSVFSITSPDTSVKLDEQGRGSISFTVSNIAGRELEGRARIEPDEPGQSGWYTIEGEPQRTFGADETHQYTVQIDAPSDAPPGRYGLKLEVDSVENPDEDYAVGPQVAVEVTPSEEKATKGAFPWWIVAVGAGVLVIGGAVAFLLLRNGDEDAGPTDTAPTAAITASCSGLDCEFDGSGSSDTEGAIAGFRWDFGDGAAATGQSVAHSYESDGSYTVTLAVTDEGGNTAERTTSVSVQGAEEAGNVIYAVDSRTDAFYSLDPETGRMVEAFARLDPGGDRFTTPVAMAADSRGQIFVWSNTAPSNSLLRIDRCRGAVTVVESSIRAGGSLATGPRGPLLYSVDGDRLFVIDSRSGAIRHRVRLDQSINAGGLAKLGDGSLVAANVSRPSQATTLFRIDPPSGRVSRIGRLSRRGTIGTIGTLAVDEDGSLWGSDIARDIIFRIDPRSATVRNIISVEEVPQGMVFGPRCD